MAGFFTLGSKLSETDQKYKRFEELYNDLQNRGGIYDFLLNPEATDNFDELVGLWQELGGRAAIARRLYELNRSDF